MRATFESLEGNVLLRESSLLSAQSLSRSLQILNSFAVGSPGRSIALANIKLDDGIEGFGLDDVRPAASTIKIALVAAAIKAEATRGIDLNEPVSLDKLAETKWPSVLDALDRGFSLRLRDLCSFTITTSDNAASDILIDRVGFSRVNEWLHSSASCSPATQLLTDFSDSSIEKQGRSNTITARDAVKILRTIVLDPTYRLLQVAMVNNVRNQRIPRFLDDSVYVAHKTGSLNGVINDIGVIISEKGSFVLAALCDGQKDSYETECALASLAQKLVTLDATSEIT